MKNTAIQKVFSLVILGFIFSLPGECQFSRYVVRLKDKGNSPYSLSNPLQYLTQRSLDRRARYNISLDSTDLPVPPRYIDSLRSAGNVTILNISKWLNQVAIQTTDAAALDKINSFPFVISTEGLAARLPLGMPVSKQLSWPVLVNTPEDNSTQSLTGYYNYGQSEAQIKIHNADFLHNHGFRGEGMQMAILDAGFFHYLSLPTFDSVRNNNQVLGTWDFVTNDASVDEDYYHGMQCFSIVAANLPGTFVGTAPKTSFYLFRTEDVNSEYPIEEQNWAAGVERADSLGVDITSTSLGYTLFDNPALNHTYADMDGNTTISARAADFAAKKGMLIVGALGNEGNSAWHYLITPADADSTLSVGAVDVLGNVGSFSSYGPSSDGQVKPSVAAVGVAAVVANTSDGQPIYNSGTSFACPNMAGITTCLWQAFPEINNMGIIEALESSGTRANDPDDRVGYGIPDAKKAFVILQRKSYNGQSTFTDCNVALRLAIKADNTMSIVVERKLEGEPAYSPIITIQNPDSYGIHNFSYSDDISNAVQGFISYRFKMIIGSDTTFYLDSLAVNHAENCNGIAPSNNISITQQIIQHEVSENADIRINRITPARINIVIQNAAGQKVYSSQLQQAAGSQTITIPLTQLLAARGAYFMSVFVDGKKVRTKEVLRP